MATAVAPNRVRAALRGRPEPGIPTLFF